MIFIKNLKKETKFKFLRFLFFSICVIMNLCLLTEAKSNYNYYNINLPKKVNGIESVQYYINDAPCGSTDGVNSIKLKQDTKLKFSVKFEENKYNKLKFKDLKLKQNNNIIKFNLYKKDENNNIILYEPNQNEYINTNQEYVSSEINIDSDCNFYFNKLKQDIYNIKIKSNLDNINNINLKYRIINQENINNYGDFKTDYIYDYNLNMFKIPDLTPDCTLELIITPDSPYSKSNFNVFYNNKKINSNNNIFKITEINSDGEILIDNLEKNKYTINSSTEKINVKNIVLNHGDSYEFNCVNNTPDDCYVTVNNIIVKPDQNNMYKIHNITEDLNINFTKKSDAEHRIYFDKILKYYNITDINNNSINYLNVKDNQEARFNLTPKPDYSDSIITNEIFSEVMYDFDNNSHKISFDSGNYVIKNVTSSLNLYSNDVPKNKYFVKIVGNLSNLSFYNLVVNNTKIFDHTKEIIVEYGDTVDLNFDVIDGYDCSDSYVTTHPVLESITGSDGSFILNNINSNLYINIHNIKKIIDEDVITVKSTPVMDYTSFYQDYYNTYYADKNVREEIFENSLVNQFSNLFNNSLNFDIFKPVSKLENITDSDVQKAQELYENSEEYQEFLQKQEELKLEEKTEQKEDFTEKETEQEASTQNSESDINNEKVASAAEVAYAEGGKNDYIYWKEIKSYINEEPSNVLDFYHIKTWDGEWWTKDNISIDYLTQISVGSDYFSKLLNNTSGEKDVHEYLVVPKNNYTFNKLGFRVTKSGTDGHFDATKLTAKKSNVSDYFKNAWHVKMTTEQKNEVEFNRSGKIVTVINGCRIKVEIDQSVKGAYGSDVTAEDLFDVYYVDETNPDGGSWYSLSSFEDNKNKGNLSLRKHNINGSNTIELHSNNSNNDLYVIIPKDGKQLTFERGSSGDVKAESIYDDVNNGNAQRASVGAGFEYAWELKYATNNDKIKVSVKSVNFNMNPGKDTDDTKATGLLKLYQIKKKATDTWYSNALTTDDRLNEGLLEMKMYPKNDDYTQKTLLFGAYPYEDYVIVPQKGYRFEVSGNNAQKVTDKYTGVHGDFANAYIVHNLQNNNTIDITLHNVKWSQNINNLFDVYYLRSFDANGNSSKGKNDWYTKKVSELETKDVNSEYGMYKRPNLNDNKSTALMPNYDGNMVYVLVPKEANLKDKNEGMELNTGFFLSNGNVNLKHISVQGGVDMTKITDPRLKNAWIMTGVGHGDSVTVDTNVFKVNVDGTAALPSSEKYSCWIKDENGPIMKFENMGTSYTVDNNTKYHSNATFYLPKNYQKSIGTQEDPTEKRFENIIVTDGSPNFPENKPGCNKDKYYENNGGYYFETNFTEKKGIKIYWDDKNATTVDSNNYSGKAYRLFSITTNLTLDQCSIEEQSFSDRVGWYPAKYEHPYTHKHTLIGTYTATAKNNGANVMVKLYGSPPETIEAKLNVNGKETDFENAELEDGANYVYFKGSEWEYRTDLSSLISKAKGLSDPGNTTHTKSDNLFSDFYCHDTEAKFGSTSEYYGTDEFELTISPLTSSNVDDDNYNNTFWTASELILKLDGKKLDSIATGNLNSQDGFFTVTNRDYDLSDGTTVNIDKGAILEYVGQQIKEGKSVGDYKNLELVVVYGECGTPEDNNDKYVQINYLSSTMMDTPKLITDMTVSSDKSKVTINEVTDLLSYNNTRSIYNINTDDIKDSTDDPWLGNDSGIYILVPAKTNYKRSGPYSFMNDKVVDVYLSKIEGESGGLQIVHNNKTIDGMILKIKPNNLKYWTTLTISNIWLDIKDVDLIFESSPGTEFYEFGEFDSAYTKEYNYDKGVGLNHSRDSVINQTGDDIDVMKFKNNLDKIRLGEIDANYEFGILGTTDADTETETIEDANGNTSEVTYHKIYGIGDDDQKTDEVVGKVYQEKQGEKEPYTIIKNMYDMEIGKINGQKVESIEDTPIEIGIIDGDTIILYSTEYTKEPLPFLITRSDDKYTQNFKIMLTDINGDSASYWSYSSSGDSGYGTINNSEPPKDTDSEQNRAVIKGYVANSLTGFDSNIETWNPIEDVIGRSYLENVYCANETDSEKKYYDPGEKKFYFNNGDAIGAKIEFNQSLYLRVIRGRSDVTVCFPGKDELEGIKIIDTLNNTEISGEQEYNDATVTFNIIPEEGYEMPNNISVELDANGTKKTVPVVNGKYVLIEPEDNSQVFINYTPVKKEYDVFFTQYDGVEYKDKANINTYTGSTKAKHGEDFSFCVNLDRLSAYSDVDPNSLKVTVVSETHSKNIPIDNGSGKYVYTDENGYTTEKEIDKTGTYLSKDGNVYTIHNVNDNYRILVDGLEVNKYTVTFKAHDGIVYMDQYGLKELGEDEKSEDTDGEENPETQSDSSTDSNKDIEKIVVHDGSVGFRVVPIEDSGIDENSIVVWAVSKQNGIDVTTRLYKSGDGTYFINNIMTDYDVYIEDVKKTTHVINFRPAEGVTYLSSTGEVINSDVTVSYGEDLEFSLLIADDYNKSEPKVYIKGIDTPLTKTGDNKYILEDIKEDKTIEVLNVTKNTYTVSFENTEGVEYKTIKNKKIEDSIEAEYDGSFQFKITLLDAYDKSVPSVILNGTEPLAESNGVYTINKITGDVKITVENITKNPEELTMEDILSIPDPVNSEADVNQVISATKSYDNLSEEDKLFVTNSGVLEKAQEASKDINHNSDGISVTGVDWNLKLVVTDLNHDEEAKEDLNSEIDRKELISLYDIKLINLMTNEEHEVPYGQEISVTIPTVDTTGYENIVVVHENSAGGIEYLNADVGTDTILFKTKSFSKFGVAGKKIPNYTENPSDMSMSVAGLVEDEEELKTLLGDNLSSQLGELINLDNSTDSTLSSTKKHSSNSPLAEYDDTWFIKLYKWAVNNELLAVLIVLLFGVIIILLMILLGRKKNNSDN